MRFILITFFKMRIIEVESNSLEHYYADTVSTPHPTPVFKPTPGVHMRVSEFDCARVCKVSPAFIDA